MKNAERFAPKVIVQKEPTNLSLNKVVKYPALALAAELGYTLSEWTERLWEVELVRHGKVKKSFLNKLREPQPKGER